MKFVTLIPLEFWAIILLMVFGWITFGLGGLVVIILFALLLFLPTFG